MKCHIHFLIFEWVSKRKSYVFLEKILGIWLRRKMLTLLCDGTRIIKRVSLKCTSPIPLSPFCLVKRFLACWSVLVFHPPYTMRQGQPLLGRLIYCVARYISGQKEEGQRDRRICEDFAREIRMKKYMVWRKKWE